ncbi:MAG: alpha/beta hydrolase [Eubacteriales bacterium]|nr:alpha/beta hydrolase [Eubacteriales bacterium]
MIFPVLLCIFLFPVLGGAWYAYRKAFYSPYKKREYLHAPDLARCQAYREDMERIFVALADSPFEAVSVCSQDGLKLTGRYYHLRSGAPVDICFHGYRSSPLTDLCCYCELAARLGHNLLLVDQRAHGGSQGRTITMGIRERQDVLSWVDFVLERFGQQTRLLLYGISMGASTVLMASELGLPENVRAIIADCPYSTPKKIIRRVSEKMGFPGWLSWHLAVLGAKLFGGFDLRESDPVRAAANTEAPILLLHGEADGFVPCEMSGDIQNANRAMIEKYTFPGADHGISYLSDPDRYRHIVTEFIEKHP